MKDKVARISDWIERADPDSGPMFNPPATEARRAAAEAQLGLALPPSARDLYLLGDGQPLSAVCLWNAFRLMALEEVVEAAAFLNDFFPGGINEENPDHAPMDVDAGIRATWWWPKWIPVLTNDSGDYLCLDLDPTAQGQVGQLISYYHDETFRRVEAPGLDPLLADIVGDLESGRFRVEDGMIEAVRT